MALTPDFDNLVLHSDASITDAVSFHAQLRDIEASPTGMLYPQIHTYKEMPLGGGAVMPGIAFVNGWTLQFPAGNFTVKGGNYTVTINPVANCYVDRTQAAAYAVTAAGGGGGVTAQEIVDLLLANQSTLTLEKFIALK